MYVYVTCALVLGTPELRITKIIISHFCPCGSVSFLGFANTYLGQFCTYFGQFQTYFRSSYVCFRYKCNTGHCIISGKGIAPSHFFKTS